MKAEKKPKRPNPFRSNIGFLNAYANGSERGRRWGEIPKPIGTLRINRSGHTQLLK